MTVQQQRAQRIASEARWSRYLLWAVLALSVMGLGWMAWQISPASPAAAGAGCGSAQSVSLSRSSATCARRTIDLDKTTLNVPSWRTHAWLAPTAPRLCVAQLLRCGSPFLACKSMPCSLTGTVRRLRLTAAKYSPTFACNRKRTHARRRSARYGNSIGTHS